MPTPLFRRSRLIATLMVGVLAAVVALALYVRPLSGSPVTPVVAAASS